MKAFKKTLAILARILAVLLLVFFVGRYGWKLGGFRACQSAGVTSVEVTDGQVSIDGFYPGSFPEGFLGYHAEEKNGTLYVGFRFSALFGFFETGDFSVQIPTKGEIKEVVLKTKNNEVLLWNEKNGFQATTEQLGVFVKLETKEAWSIAMAFEGNSEGMMNADQSAIESGKYIFMDNDIMQFAKEAGALVPFTLTVTRADGSVLASGEFDGNKERMYLVVRADGTMIEE